ncbi:response regulator, partial [Deferrisoma sp.]
MPKTVLVVDDSPTIREAVRLALAGEPWDVVEAAGEEEALAALGEASPDVVLCDADLGEGDGLGLCRRLREHPAAARAPVVLMGARVAPAAAKAAGAIAILAKPFSSEELLGALQEAVEMQSFGMDNLELDLTAEADEKRPAGAAPAPAGDEVEIIDLSDEDDLSEFELLEDLEPIEVPPPGEEEPELGLDDLLSFEADLGHGEDAGQPVDLEAAAPAGAGEAEDEIGDLLASIGEEPAEPAAAPVEGDDEDIGDLLASIADEPAEAPAAEPAGEDLDLGEGPWAAPEEEAPPAGEPGAPEEPGEPLGSAPGAGAPPPEEAAALPEEPLSDEVPEEPAAAAAATFPETPEAYEEGATGWEEPGQTPPHRADWDEGVEEPATPAAAAAD